METGGKRGNPADYKEGELIMGELIAVKLGVGYVVFADGYYWVIPLGLEHMHSGSWGVRTRQQALRILRKEKQPW